MYLLLAEDSPENLLRIHATHHLEEIVLKLCLQDTEGTKELEQDSASTSESSSIEDVPNAVILSPSNTNHGYKGKPKHNYFSKNEYSPSKLEKNVENSSSPYLPSTLTYGEITTVELKGIVCEKDKQDKKSKKNKGVDGSRKRTIGKFRFFICNKIVSFNVPVHA